VIRPFDRSTFAPVVLALLVGAGAAGALPFLPHRYGMGPPPGHTGGFGEPTCAVCHADATEGPATVTLEAPDAWEPGRRYSLTVRVEQAGLRRAGFQLTARFAKGEHEGKQAGTIESGAETRITPDTLTGVLYLSHTFESTRSPAAGEVRWSFDWVAPGAGGPVDFHVAANASNDDESEFGDIIMTGSRRVPAR
jgi:hypothetical protein